MARRLLHSRVTGTIMSLCFTLDASFGIKHFSRLYELIWDRVHICAFHFGKLCGTFLCNME